MMAFKPFSLVMETNSSGISVVLTEPIDLPYFEDGVGSFGSCLPFDPTDPLQWRQTFEAQIAWNLTDGKYSIINPNNYHEVPCDSSWGYIPFDHATGQMRNILGLLSIASQFYGDPESKMLRQMGKALLDNAEKLESEGK